MADHSPCNRHHHRVTSREKQYRFAHAPVTDKNSTINSAVPHYLR